MNKYDLIGSILSDSDRLEAEWLNAYESYRNARSALQNALIRLGNRDSRFTSVHADVVWVRQSLDKSERIQEHMDVLLDCIDREVG